MPPSEPSWCTMKKLYGAYQMKENNTSKRVSLRHLTYWTILSKGVAVTPNVLKGLINMSDIWNYWWAQGPDIASNIISSRDWMKSLISSMMIIGLSHVFQYCHIIIEIINQICTCTRIIFNCYSDGIITYNKI